MNEFNRRRYFRRPRPAELDAIELPISRRHNGGPPLDDLPLALEPHIVPLAAPALIFPRTLLRYDGIWRGSAALSSGILTVEARDGRVERLDLHKMLDGGWDGTCGMLSGTLGLWAASAARTVIAGSQTFTSNGSLAIPNYNRLEVLVIGPGAGGGGGSADGAAANNASDAIFNSSTPVRGNGGGGGDAGDTGTGRSGGTASGGDTNSTGASGVNRGAGGSRAGLSGSLITFAGTTGGAVGVNGGVPGSGGGGGAGSGSNRGGGGGAGGAALKMWARLASGAPPELSSVSCTVPNGTGGGAEGSSPGTGRGGDGARAEIRTAWD